MGCCVCVCGCGWVWVWVDVCVSERIVCSRALFPLPNAARCHTCEDLHCHATLQAASLQSDISVRLFQKLHVDGVRLVMDFLVIPVRVVSYIRTLNGKITRESSVNLCCGGAGLVMVSFLIPGRVVPDIRSLE